MAKVPPAKKYFPLISDYASLIKDAVSVTGVLTVAAAGTALTVAGANFTSAVTGKTGMLHGVSGASYPNRPLITTLTYVDSTHVTLGAAATAALATQGTFWYGTDNSAAIKAAHDSAYAAGERYLYFPAGNYFAPNLSACGNVIFVGPGVLIGAYRKQIIPLSGPAPYRFNRGVRASAHMSTFLAAGSPKVAFVGDSIGTSIANNVTGSSYIAEMVDFKLRAENPTKNITFFDFAIGGLAWSDLASASAPAPARLVNSPWYTNQSASWMSYIQAFAPDLVFIELGTNFSTPTTEIPAIYSAIAQIKAFAKVPDIILLTPFIPSSMNPSWNTPFAGESRDAVAAFMRGLALRTNLGLIDTNRVANMTREGLDPQREEYAVVNSSFSIQTPWIAPYQTHDLYLNWQMNATQLGFLTTGVGLLIQLGSWPGHDLMLYRLANGNFGISVINPGGTNGITAFDTGQAIPGSGTGYFEFKIKGNYVWLGYSPSAIVPGQATKIFGSYVERLGSAFNPKVYFSNSTATGLFCSAFAVSTQQPLMPSMTDIELYGSYLASDPVYGGSGDVHPSARGSMRLYGPVLDQEILAAA
jgi:hypothetical protein